MKINADIRREVNIDPMDVIEKLIRNIIGDGWIIERDNKYYRIYEVNAGSHTKYIEEDIVKEDYDYVKALELVLDRLKSYRL